MADAGGSENGGSPPPLPSEQPPPWQSTGDDGAIAARVPPPWAADGAAPDAGPQHALTVVGGESKPVNPLGISEDQLDASNIRAVEVHERYASGAPITTADLVKRLAMVPLGPPTGK